jgi:hypothetical protein
MVPLLLVFIPDTDRVFQSVTILNCGVQQDRLADPLTANGGPENRRPISHPQF